MARITTYGDNNGSRESLKTVPKGLSGALGNASGVGSDSLVFTKWINLANPSGGTETTGVKVPFDLRITGARIVKTGATGAGGDKVEVKNGSSVVSLIDLNTIAAKAISFGNLDVSVSDFQSGNLITIVQTKATTSAEGSLVITYIEL